MVPIPNFWWGSYYGFATGQNSVDLQRAVGLSSIVHSYTSHMIYKLHVAKYIYFVATFHLLLLSSSFIVIPSRTAPLAKPPTAFAVTN